MSRSNHVRNTTETKDIRNLRLEAEFGKFRASAWDGRKSDKQKRQAWKQKGEHIDD